jgi:hypothetical protein
VVHPIVPLPPVEPSEETGEQCLLPGFEPTSSDDVDPTRQARRASEQAAAYLAARRRQLRDRRG